MKSKMMMGSKEIKTLKKTMMVNKGDLDLYLDLFVDGEKVLSKKADSLVANFLRILFIQMGGKTDELLPTGYYLKADATIDSLSSGTNGLIRVKLTANKTYASTGGKAAIYGTNGVIDGIYDYNYISGYYLDLAGTTYASQTIEKGYVYIFSSYTASPIPSNENFSSPLIEVGNGNTAVNIADFCLANKIPNGSGTSELTYNSMIVAQDTNDSDSAQITFTRSFTNGSGAAVSINEIGMYSTLDNYGSVLIMRDIISSIEVANGKTLTVNYRIKTVLDSGADSGGFVLSFMRLLYRQFGQAERAIIDINNTSQSQHYGNATLKAIGTGGYNYNTSAAYSTSEPGWKQGIVLGTGSTEVSMSDYFLSEVIGHGTDSGEMVYYGGIIENFIIGDDYAQFDILRAVGNDSGDTITVNEYILTAGARDDASGTAVDIPNYLFTISRNVLDEGIVVADGEILKCVYTIKLIVSTDDSGSGN